MDLNTHSYSRSSWIATNERDEAFLGVLRQHGCFLFEDLHLDFEKEAKEINKQRGGRWKSVNGAALEFMVEAHIVKTAEVAYSMGSSSLDVVTKFFRTKEGYSPALLYDEEKSRFLEDGGDLKAKEVEEFTDTDNLSAKLRGSKRMQLESGNQPGLRRGWKTIDVFIGEEADEIPEGPSWHSQAGQDKTIARIFEGKRPNGGFFLDLAASNAVKFSNSLALERDHGWNGICIEPNVENWFGLSHRKCKVVGAVAAGEANTVVDMSFTGTSRHGGSSMLGGIVGDRFDNKKPGPKGVQKRRTVSFRDVLERYDAPKTIDYFSLDIEGAELEVMKVFPFDVYTFLTLTVERPNAELSNILEENGYAYIMDHGTFGDKLFLHRRAFEELNTAWLNVTAPAYLRELTPGLSPGHAEPSTVSLAPKLSSSSERIAFQFVIGVEGTGHHLHRKMYQSSPVGKWLVSNKIKADIRDLSLALWDPANKSGGIWSAPCSNANTKNVTRNWWKTEEDGPEGGILFDTLVERLQGVEKKVEEALANVRNSSFPVEQPIVIAINVGVAGMSMSYPMSGGPCRALQYPHIDILYRACDVAGVRCQHSVAFRDPYRVLRSTSMNRHFASRHVQLTTLASMQHIILSQMMAHPDRLVACWESDADTKIPKELGQLFGWTDPADFEEAYNNLFIAPPLITATERKEIVNDDNLKVYMDGMVASSNRIKELCFQQLESSNQRAPPRQLRPNSLQVPRGSN